MSQVDPRECRLCASPYWREQAEIRTIVEARDPQRFAAAIRGLCERHLDQIGRILGIPRP